MRPRQAYTKNFGDKFKLVAEDGPVKTGGVDTYTYEYIVETELGSKYEKVHFVSRFSASAENVYIVNAQAKEASFKESCSFAGLVNGVSPEGF